MTEDEQVECECRRTEVWDAIMDAYREALGKVRDVLDRNPDIHIYEVKNGWDANARNPLTMSAPEEMTAEDILGWMYEESVLDRGKETASPPMPFIYTDAEIAWLKETKVAQSIQSWKRSIRMHQDSIDRYRKLIRENGGAVEG